MRKAMSLVAGISAMGAAGALALGCSGALPVTGVEPLDGVPPQAPALPGAPATSSTDRVYTADQTSNTVSVIDAGTNTLLGTIALGGAAAERARRTLQQSDRRARPRILA